MKINEINVQGYDTLLLDRDGTINVHIIDGYVQKWDDFEFIPGVLDAMSYFASKCRYVFIVTNQRGIGKCKYTDADLSVIHALMMQEIEKVGGRIDNIYYCSSLTDDDISRKPGRGMFDAILNDYPDVNPQTTLMLGDGDVDEEFAKNCGISFQRVDSLKRENNNKYWVNCLP